jgi:hypothetical protein
MTQLQRSATIVAVDFARGTVPIGCDPAFYRKLLDALTRTLTRLAEQVPDGRELEDVGTVIAEDSKSLVTYGYFENSNGYPDIVAGINGVTYDRGNPLTYPATVDNALRWLATQRLALN